MTPSDQDEVTQVRNEILRDQQRGKINGLQRILASYEGREFVWDLYQTCGMFTRAPDGDMARFEGTRDLGCDLHEKVLTADANAFILMQNEAADRDTAAARKLQEFIEREVDV